MKRRLSVLFIGLFFCLSLSLNAQQIISSFDAPGPEPRGLAWDGQYLWCADAEHDSIYKLDPASGAVLHSLYFDFHYTYGGGITWDGEDVALWVTSWQYFYKLNAENGVEMTNFHCPGG